MEGKFVRKANGKNSVIPDDSEKPIFVSERNSMGAPMATGWNSPSWLVVRITSRRHRSTKSFERAKDTFVGRLKVDKDLAYLVTPGDVFAHNIIIPRRKVKGGKTDDKAVVRLLSGLMGKQSPIGEVVDILGQMGDNDVEMNSILAQYGLPYKYPKNVEDAANKISGEITEQDYKEREGLRKVFTFAPSTRRMPKDFDDALSIQRLENGNWRVGVHIADVSHYVTEGSIIDKEAVKRATSVYLVDRTIPMLPERLCNFICSLRPNEEKLAYSVIFELDNNAEVKNYRIVHTVTEATADINMKRYRNSSKQMV